MDLADGVHLRGRFDEDLRALPNGRGFVEAHPSGKAVELSLQSIVFEDVSELLLDLSEASLDHQVRLLRLEPLGHLLELTAELALKVGLQLRQELLYGRIDVDSALI